MLMLIYPFHFSEIYRDFSCSLTRIQRCGIQETWIVVLVALDILREPRKFPDFYLPVRNLYL
jgi:hypothetical protein